MTGPTSARGGAPGRLVRGHGAIGAYARALMDEHGLREWAFGFDRSVSRLGCCHYRTKSITLSAALVRPGIREDVLRETVLHEIAHALAGHAAAHGPRWRAVALSIGSSGARTYNGAEVAAVPYAWVGRCPECGAQCARHRRGQVACARCCKEHAGGRFDERFRLVWSRLEPGSEVRR